MNEELKLASLELGELRSFTRTLREKKMLKQLSESEAEELEKAYEAINTLQDKIMKEATALNLNVWEAGDYIITRVVGKRARMRKDWLAPAKARALAGEEVEGIEVVEESFISAQRKK